MAQTREKERHGPSSYKSSGLRVPSYRVVSRTSAPRSFGDSMRNSSPTILRLVKYAVTCGCRSEVTNAW